MREFLYKNSFFRYAAAINLCGGKRMPIVAPLISFYIVLFVSLFSGISSLNAVGASAAVFACFLFFVGSLIGLHRNASPNLARLIPISGKRKCLYDYFAVLLYTLIGIVCAALVIGIFALIVWAATSAFGGAEDGGATEEILVRYHSGVYSGIFCAAYVIILYSAGMLGGYFKSRKRRNIFYALFIFALILGLFFTMIPYLNNAQASSENSALVSPFVEECYAYMKLPWLCVLFWCLIAAAMLFWSVYKSRQYHNPKKY